jgi:hypothetical protein
VYFFNAFNMTLHSAASPGHRGNQQTSAVQYDILQCKKANP